MTRYISRPEDNNEDNRSTRVRLPQQMSARIFQGWGPKF
jgi:hypothetical protein